jgi:1,2-phenylacetyl-CoA epoxidase PaaB subunit
MYVWDVLGKRTVDDRWAVVGGVKAPDAGLALILAKETHFRHKEGVRYAVRRRGDRELHPGPYEGDLLGGLTDRSYRRQEAYVGVGARHRRVSEEMAARGLLIDRPRPPAGRAGPAAAKRPRTGTEERDGGKVPSGADLSPEDLAAHGTAG